uniref:Uncharacterized protein n=1 Tax=Anguilla anguilla TaxID=7936 RepID=A0A0E9QFI4_ANGAN
MECVNICIAVQYW